MGTGTGTGTGSVYEKPMGTGTGNGYEIMGTGMGTNRWGIFYMSWGWVGCGYGYFKCSQETEVLHSAFYYVLS